MTRLQQILSGLLVLQIVLAVFVLLPRPVDSAAGGPLFAELNAEDIVSVTLEDGEGISTQLLRQGDGWILADAGDYPADAAKIDPILAKIAAIQTNRLVARSSSSHRRLLVADNDFGQRIDLGMRDGSEETLLVGTAPNPGGTHVRRGDQDETYLTGELAVWEINPAVTNWIDTSYISLDRPSVVALTLENDNGAFAFARTADEEWLLDDLAEGEAMEASAINTLVTRVTTMRMTQPLGTAEQPEYGLGQPRAKVTVVTENSEDQSTRTYTLLVGAQDAGDEGYFVKWSESDYYVKVAPFNVEEMVNNARDDFIMEPPTPTPGPEPAPTDETVTPTPAS